MLVQPQSTQLAVQPGPPAGLIAFAAQPSGKPLEGELPLPGLPLELDGVSLAGLFGSPGWVGTWQAIARSTAVRLRRRMGLSGG